MVQEEEQVVWQLEGCCINPQFLLCEDERSDTVLNQTEWSAQSSQRLATV